jgi:hypothetical protein
MQRISTLSTSQCGYWVDAGPGHMPQQAPATEELLPVPLLCVGLQALRLTLVQVLMNSKGYSMNPMQSLYYVSPACLLCLIVPFCEWGLARSSV